MNRILALTALLAALFACCPSSAAPTPIAATATPAPTDTPAPTATTAPTPTPETFVTLDGYDPASDSVIDPINLWMDYDDRSAGIAAKGHHGDRVKLVGREGDGVLVETADGIQGWVTYWFIKEFK